MPQQTAPSRLYWSIGPNSYRVRIFLAEKGIELPRVYVDFDKGEHKAPAFMKLNSLGQVPVLVLDDGTDDELMTITFENAGAKGQQSVPTNVGKLAEQEFVVFAKGVTASIVKKTADTRPLIKFGGDREVTNGNPDAVATYVYGTDDSGKLQLRLQKRRRL